MAERLISQANLSRIESSLDNVASHVAVVSRQVDTVSQKVDGTQSELDQLRAEFAEFVQKDELSKNLQLAETRLVKVRQEIETKFGHYDEVRRRAVGILQAVDAHLVKKETIENATEEQLLAAPRYWLAPCLIALSAWINDQQDLANRALNEALRRDDEKTSLFFALISRRAGRYKSSNEWLHRYLGYQDPQQLNREVVILIDGFANGIFGPEARNKCAKQIEEWIDELSQKAGFVEEQREQWKIALQSKTQPLDNQKFPYLKEYSPNYDEVKRSMEGARLHTIIHDYFADIFSKEIQPSKNIAFAVDAMLDNLVRHYDEEELPLRRDERLYSLIVHADGDKAAATQLFNQEKVLENDLTFTQLLTNFSMHPEVSHASIATQKLSLSLSKQWIVEAHNDLTLDNRNAIPQSITIQVTDWEGTTKDGANEVELVEELTRHIDEKQAAELRQNSIGLKAWFSLVIGIFFVFAGIAAPILLLAALMFILFFVYAQWENKKTKLKIKEKYEKQLSSCKDILRAVLSDVVDYRVEYAKEDACASRVTEFLEPITPEQYAYMSYDTARSVIKTS